MVGSEAGDAFACPDDGSSATNPLVSRLEGSPQGHELHQEAATLSAIRACAGASELAPIQDGGPE